MTKSIRGGLFEAILYQAALVGGWSLERRIEVMCEFLAQLDVVVPAKFETMQVEFNRFVGELLRKEGKLMSPGAKP